MYFVSLDLLSSYFPTFYIYCLFCFIYTRRTEISAGDTPEILQKRVMEQAEWIILPEACEIVSKMIKEGK